ncbi:MAG: CBS domain-containing protein [Planctomycetota bacterium]
MVDTRTRPLVRDCMREDLIVLAPTDSLEEAVERMGARAARHALVVERGQLRGILSTTDLLGAFDREHLVFPGLVSEAMTHGPLETVTPCALAEEAAELMAQRGVHALPITSGGHPVGILTSTDLLGWLPRVMEYAGNPPYQDEDDAAEGTGMARRREEHPCPAEEAQAHPLPQESHAEGGDMTTTRARETVREWMTEELVAVSPDEPLFSAAELMAERAIRHVLVLESGQLRGIVSNRDLVRSTLRDRQRRLDLHDVTVGQVMTPTPLATVVPSTSVEEAAQIMVEHGVNALPVTSGGHPVGIVTSDDLLRSLARRRQTGRFYRPGL